MMKLNEIKIFIWFFPILFIFHDFEEIIFIKSWLKKNRGYLAGRFPKLSQRLFHHFDRITTASFALGVAEEFILICVITISAYLMNWYPLWLGFFIAFTLHLIIHCVQVLIVRKYVPAIVTSVICLPACFYILQQTVQLFPLKTVILYAILTFVIMLVNLLIVHKGMDLFSRWQENFEERDI